MELLLHICCANCGLAAVEKLLPDFKLTLFWYNPNIYPLAEYQKRLADVKKLVKLYKLNLVVGGNDSKKWFILTKGLEKEPEKGRRCLICFKMRLEKTAQFAKRNGFDCWGTTLSAGPQKDAQAINSIGILLAKKYDTQFYQANFKKKDGFKKSVTLSKKYNFYRQNYCGCVFSQKY